MRNKRNRDSSTGRFVKTDPVPVLERFVEFIDEDPELGCWLWLGGTKSQMGYGAFAVKHGHVVSAHRWAYEYFREPIPPGLDVDHLCRNPICVNPWHMEIVTRRENLRRGRNARRERTHCLHGHPYAGENLIIRKSDGARLCKTCLRSRKKK